MTSSVAVFEAAIWVELSHMTKSWLKTRKKRKYGKTFFHKSPSNTLFRKGNGIHSLRGFAIALSVKAYARGSADIIYRMWRILCRSGIVIDVKSRTRREYLIPTDNIIVLDLFFNLTMKSNLIDRVLYDLTP